MAKKRAAVNGPTPRTKRHRRTDEELIADLQAKIREIEMRKKARELKQSPAIKALDKAIKAIDAALDVAAEQEETLLRHVLADARRPLVEYAEKNGLPVGKARLPRGRRPKA